MTFTQIVVSAQPLIQKGAIATLGAHAAALGLTYNAALNHIGTFRAPRLMVGAEKWLKGLTVAAFSVATISYATIIDFDLGRVVYTGIATLLMVWSAHLFVDGGFKITHVLMGEIRHDAADRAEAELLAATSKIRRPADVTPEIADHIAAIRRRIEDLRARAEEDRSARKKGRKWQLKFPLISRDRTKRPISGA